MDTYSHNDGREALQVKGELDAVHEIPRIWAKHAGQSSYTERSEALQDLGGWKTETQIDLGPEEASHNERLTPFLDVYHAGHNVAVEHERMEQMRARWHLLKMQAASEREDTLDIDVAVLLFPDGEDCSLRRTRRELEGPFFDEHFPIEIPVYVVEYDSDDW